jgi:HSP20 family protein
MLIWRRRPLAASPFEDHTDVGPEVEWLPDLDIYQGPDDFILVVSLPGVRLEDMDLVVSDRTLTISGQRVLSLPAVVVPHLLESPRGRFQRRVRLPANAELTRLRVEVRHGQLFVTVPKAMTTESTIEIGVP